MKKKSSRGFIVTIDGPAGAGKSTVSRMLADDLSGVLLDTGGMYRGVAYFCLKAEATRAAEYARIARGLDFDIDLHSKQLLINGDDLGLKLRTPKVSEMSSYVGRFKGVRQVLTAQQRRLGRKSEKHCPIVVEGRDIGTVVFPKARFKFYVTADAKVRARRRYNQLKSKGVSISFKTVLADQERRDDADSNRKIAPLRCPEGAVIVDTSKMGIAQVVHFMKNHIDASFSTLG